MIRTWKNNTTLLGPLKWLNAKVAAIDPIAIFIIVFPVNKEINKDLGRSSKSFTFSGIFSLCFFKLKYAVSALEKNAEIIKSPGLGHLQPTYE